MQNTARGSVKTNTVCQDTNTAQGKVKCCIYVSTSSRVIFFICTSSGGTLSGVLYFELPLHKLYHTIVE